MMEFQLARKLGDMHLNVSATSTAQVLALFGPSGSGKTSILKMLAGLLEPDHGHIVLNGKTVFNRAQKINLPARARAIAYVPQHGVLFPHLSVARNVTFGVWAGGRTARIDLGQLAARLRIAGLLERFPAQLSGGERQRVALARALYASPGLILLDEPLSALDDALRAEALELIDNVIREVATPVILVTHSLPEVTRIADEMLVMEKGRLRQFGKTHEVIASGEEASGFAAQVLLDGTIVSQTSDAALGRVRTSAMEFVMASDLPPPGTPVRLRIDPRDVMLSTSPAEGISAQNRFAGIIREIKPFGDPHQRMVLVHVAVGGEVLIARITRHAQAKLQLACQMPVHAVIKAVALHEVV